MEGVDSKYSELLSYLLECFPKYCEDQADHQADLIKNIANALGKGKRDNVDYSYLRDKLKNQGTDSYPVLYFQEDKEKKYPIFINLEQDSPRFVLKDEIDNTDDTRQTESGDCDCSEGDSSHTVSWQSGNQICKKVAKL